MIECTARFRLLNVGSSGLREWCWHRSPRLGGAGLTCRPPRPAALVVIREYASASSCLAHFGGGKIRQTPCVLSLAKIINKKILFILRRRRKIYKRCLIFARSSPPIRQKSFIEEKQAAGKPKLLEA